MKDSLFYYFDKNKKMEPIITLFQNQTVNRIGFDVNDYTQAMYIALMKGDTIRIKKDCVDFFNMIDYNQKDEKDGIYVITISLDKYCNIKPKYPKMFFVHIYSIESDSIDVNPNNPNNLGIKSEYVTRLDSYPIKIILREICLKNIPFDTL